LRIDLNNETSSYNKVEFDFLK